MVNMKSTFFQTALTFALVSILLSCCQQHRYQLNHAYKIASSCPDSALVYLNNLDKNNFSEEDLAKYALIYYMAQDKSGLDVDNDSLIRIAYNWYKKHQSDSLYALCLNYMGKYYMLNDSLEKAKVCLESSLFLSTKIKDKNTQLLALDKLIEVEEIQDPYKAVKLSRELVNMYKYLPHNNLRNETAARLRLCDNLMFVDSLSLALLEIEKVKNIIKHSKDIELLSSVYQDLSCIMGECGMTDSCLNYAKQAYSLNGSTMISCQLNLVSAYLKTDSIKKATSLLKSIRAKDSKDRYAVFYLQNQAAMKSFDFEKSKAYSDSAFFCLEDMYRKTLHDKSKYYSFSLEKEKEKAILQGRTEMQRWLLGLSVFLFVTIIFSIWRKYLQSKKSASQKLQYEEQQAKLLLAHKKEMYQQQKEMMEKLHQEELAHKEIQLSCMRKYLLSKIEVIEKLNSIKKGDYVHIVLSVSDWKEIELFLESTENLFVTRLRHKHPNLTDSDVKLMMLLRLNLSQKALSCIYCISEKAIKQKLFLYKDKVGIKNEHFSLRNYIENL